MALFFQIPNTPLALKRKIRPTTPAFGFVFLNPFAHPAKPTLGSFLKLPLPSPNWLRSVKTSYRDTLTLKIGFVFLNPALTHWVRSAKRLPGSHRSPQKLGSFLKIPSSSPPPGFEAQKDPARPSPCLRTATHMPKFDTPSPSSVTLMYSSPSKRENKSVHAYRNSVQACDRAFLARD